jgi:hypothetical protein
MNIPGLAIVVSGLVSGSVVVGAAALPDPTPSQIDVNQAKAVQFAAAAAPPWGPSHRSHASHASHRSHFSSSPKPW